MEAPQEVQQPQEIRATEYFAVPIKKLVLFSVLTWGIYNIYWYYKNWKAIKIQEEVKIWPVPRAIFAIFFLL